jgi:hypothetical protein
MKINKRFVALVVAGAMVVGTVGLSASAQAAEITPVGTITISPTSGNVNTDVNFLDSIRVSVGAPVGFRALSGTFVYQNGVEVGSVSQARSTSMVSTAGTNGLDGNPAFMDRSIIPTNTFVSNRLLNNAALSTLTTGAFELRYYYFASSTAPNRATDPYVKLDMTYNTTSGAWGFPAAAAIATTTSLAASASGTSVTVSATVKSGTPSTTATAAAGTVSFFEGVTQVGTTQTVAAGLASVSLTGVANGAHSYTATFTPSDAVYSTSTSATSTVQVGGVQAQPSTTVTVPANAGSLTLTGVSTSVALGTAVLNTTSNTLDASGTLNAVVSDTRQTDAASWSLTGQVGDFTAAGSKTISGKYLGWTPSVLNGSIGSAGSAVLPYSTTGNGLKDISPLSNGAPSYAGDLTTVSAVLLLKAPAKTAAGAYTATLTLTLI